MPNERTDIHNEEDRLKWNQRKFSDSDQVAQPNKEAIHRFTDKCCANGLSTARVKKFITNWHTIFKRFTPDNFLLEEAEKPEIGRTVANIERDHYSERTKSDFKTAVKKCYKLMGDEHASITSKILQILSILY
jgi:hypothetical protein